jgi:predicted ATPase
VDKLLDPRKNFPVGSDGTLRFFCAMVKLLLELKLTHALAVQLVLLIVAIVALT